MSGVEGLLPLGLRELSGLLRGGRAVRPEELVGYAFHGVALGNPRWVERLTWKTFKKAFVAESDGVVWGWNVAVEQAGPHGPFTDRRKRGARVTYGHYTVRAGAEESAPLGWQSGLVLDYGRGWGSPLGPRRRGVKDPLVALEDGALLLGGSYLDLGPGQVPVPAFFALTRGEALDYRPGA